MQIYILQFVLGNASAVFDLVCCASVLYEGMPPVCQLGGAPEASYYVVITTALEKAKSYNGVTLYSLFVPFVILELYTSHLSQ